VSVNMHQPDVEVDEDGTIHLGPRSIPLPSFLSAAARECLRAPRQARPAFPSLEDHKAWKRLIADRNAAAKPGFDRMLESTEGLATVESTTIAGVTVELGTPVARLGRRSKRVWIYVHPGGFVFLAGIFPRPLAALTAAQWGDVTYAVDYRVPPDYPYPAAVDDVLAVYRELLNRHRPGNIVVMGSSSGGNTASAALLKARDQGLPLPAALILETPAIDLTQSGDTFQTLRDLDPHHPRGSTEHIALYAGGHDLTDPYLSPLFADFTKGFPPTYIQSGTRDILLSNAVRLHRVLRDSCVDAELHVWDGAIHMGFGIGVLPGAAPETADMKAEQARFLAKYCPSS
jgi:monoterpene epsilon-lactone hydrolase